MRSGGNSPWLGLAIAGLLLGSCSAGFYEEFNVTWAGGYGNNVVPNDSVNEVKLRLDPSGGATFKSIQTYLFGSFSTRMKLVPGDSAGTVCSFFLSSSGTKQDEIDFEFLGNSTGQPYKLQTNLYIGGVGRREQQIIPWFDPTADFHNYTVVWNSKQITWYVDNTVIRIFKHISTTYATNNAMAALGTIFDASTWATEGGRVPINYAYSPFVVTFDDFNITGCKASGTNVLGCKRNLSSNWWEAPKYWNLTSYQLSQLQSVQGNLTYDYCTDKTRHSSPPYECLVNAG